MCCQFTFYSVDFQVSQPVHHYEHLVLFLSVLNKMLYAKILLLLAEHVKMIIAAKLTTPTVLLPINVTWLVF